MMRPGNGRFFYSLESIKLSKLPKTPFLRTQEVMTTEGRSFLVDSIRWVKGCFKKTLDKRCEIFDISNRVNEPPKAHKDKDVRQNRGRFSWTFF